ncbi:hypothetical protein ALP05_04279 [Pseudomonas caricapapayae]|uniref:Uncharacterized protein n=1 Tax=Pseudomonas caricapapayae TaxID=46678 RepID=A0A3M6EZV6_9PSED|nr:hypothetical protein ALP05_04279 [Pseudomonas caricapapayae]
MIWTYISTILNRLTINARLFLGLLLRALARRFARHYRQSPLLADGSLSGRSTFDPSQSLITPPSIDVGEHLNIESKCHERGAGSSDHSPVHKSGTFHKRFKLLRTAALEALGIVDNQ